MMLLTAVPSRAVMTPPTKGVHVPDKDSAASNKPNSVLDVPISRESRLLRGPRMYVALGTGYGSEMGNRDRERDALVTSDTQRACTQQSESSDQLCLPLTPPPVGFVSLKGLLSQVVIEQPPFFFLAFNDAQSAVVLTVGHGGSSSKLRLGRRLCQPPSPESLILGVDLDAVDATYVILSDYLITGFPQSCFAKLYTHEEVQTYG